MENVTEEIKNKRVYIVRLYIGSLQTTKEHVKKVVSQFNIQQTVSIDCSCIDTVEDFREKMSVENLLEDNLTTLILFSVEKLKTEVLNSIIEETIEFKTDLTKPLLIMTAQDQSKVANSIRARCFTHVVE